MAIVTEQFYVEGRLLNKTYSDAGRYIISDIDGERYEEACDPAEFNRTYTEGDLIDGGAELIEILNILTGEMT